jgi:hypothetical protein
VCPSTEAVDSNCGLADRLDAIESSFAFLCPDNVAKQAAEKADVLTFRAVLRD